jgi:hypothetical protein
VNAVLLLRIGVKKFNFSALLWDGVIAAHRYGPKCVFTAVNPET